MKRILLLLALLLIVCLPVLADAPKELKGHDALVYSVAFSPDGKTLATAGFDNTVKLWDFTSGKTIRTLSGHTGPVYCVTFSKDGKQLASSSLDKTIRLWNPADGKSIREIKGHTDIVDSIAFSPDGKLLASVSADKTVRLWNPADGKEVKNLGAHGNHVYSVAFSPDGTMLASGGADMAIKLWDVKTQKEIKTIKMPAGAITAAVTGVVFTPDGQQLVSIGQDRLVRLWNVKTGAQVKEMGPTPDDLYGVAFSRDGKFAGDERLRRQHYSVEPHDGQGASVAQAEGVRRILHRLHAGRQVRRHRTRQPQLLYQFSQCAVNDGGKYPGESP